MDVAALRPDELTAVTAAPTAARIRRRRGWLLTPYLVLAVLLALLGLLVAHRSDLLARDARQSAAVAAARQEALALTSISYQHTDADLQRIIAGATGDLAKQFTAQRAGLPAALQRTKSTTAGTVLATGLEQLSQPDGTAKVTVAVDATVTTQPAAGAQPQSVLKHYRMVLTMQRIHGRWLASDVAFAGAPQ